MDTGMMDLFYELKVSEPDMKTTAEERNGRWFARYRRGGVCYWLPCAGHQTRDGAAKCATGQVKEMRRERPRCIL